MTGRNPAMDGGIPVSTEATESAPSQKAGAVMKFFKSLVTPQAARWELAIFYLAVLILSSTHTAIGEYLRSFARWVRQ
jgi:hypothetical protein